MRANGRYILDGRTPVLEPDLLTWGRWMETTERHVGEDTIGETRISTVFLGLDHGFGEPVPILFETMVFGGPLDNECERYATWAEAESGHQAMIERVERLAR